MDGKILTTDGKVLSSMGFLGVGDLATWRNDNKGWNGADGIKILTSSTKIIDDIVRYIKKSFPPNVTKDMYKD